MRLTCIECKNDIDLSLYSNLQVGQAIECGMCGISLVVTAINGETVEVEVTDEGK